MVKGGESTFQVSIFLLTLLMAACVPQVTVSASRGPRTADLIMQFYANVSTAYQALVVGDVDVVGSPLPESLYEAAITNPNTALAAVDDMGMYEFDLHNNYSIASYPGIRSPTSYTEFRQALAFLVDKDRIVNEFCDGFAVRLDQPIAAPAHGWMNQSYTGGNYPYEYDPAAASALLDAHGWVEGGTPNPYYDAAFPRSTLNLRTYPPGHETAGADIDPVISYVRTDDARRLQAGRQLYGNMRKIGIPVDPREGPSSFTSDPVMGQRDYHIYTGSWNLGRFPTFPYFGYHTDYYIPYGGNYVTGYQADNAKPAHPMLDPLLYNIYYADTFEQAYENCQLAMGLFTELCVTIPLFSARSYWAYSTKLLGAVNMDGYGLGNDYFFMNVYKVDSSPIVWAVTTPPNRFNVLYSSWSYDFQCLDRIYDYANADLPPYNIAFDQPGWVLDWFADTWVDPDDGRIKARNFKEFRTDNYFVDAEGNQLENVDADAYLFSCYVEHTRCEMEQWGCVSPLHHFVKVDDYRVEVYFNGRSYWLCPRSSSGWPRAQPPLLPRSVWLNTSHGLTENLVETFVVDTNLTTPGFLGLDNPVWIGSINGSASGLLTEWVDYHWERGDWYLDTALVTGETVIVEWYQFADVFGLTLGDNPAQDVTISCGQYYLTGFNYGAGGNMTAKRNPYYYLETPPLGEVDFVWEEGGYYEVTIFDIVKAAGAYGSQGTAVPDKNWLPGADLAPPGGVIDIFDIVTIASAYGETFGAPPS
jgi:hypothetical protein